MTTRYPILEHAILPVVPGREAAFEAAFADAKTIISSMPGFIDLRLSRSLETPNEYLLLVHWESVEAHEVGFRGSPQYAQWRALLHEFYEPFPVVEHFAEVHRA
ncbi:antibiotic biosynthesis monooxygenase [Agromyces sp. CFH 90414]|uniref:Antibiotic biosynthesis monooxygenase n=1 Tax=Agromyces agglutinans TaxID=2662258 RepID=A0A6I2F8C3_9MICO|nr:antibiotic biosynthesis monooxygenase [Agromyces agglutinans]MRG60859.1 antibiotic biosynthesis monooxygenase [Agromyces agglutinans]